MYLNNKDTSSIQSRENSAKRIFAPNYTQVPNILLDHWISILSGSQFKVLMCLCRKTFGFHKKWDQISLTQLEKMAALSRTVIIECLNVLIFHGLVIKTKINNQNHGGNETSAYELIIYDSDQSYTPSPNSGPPLVRKMDHPLVRNSDTQKKILTKESNTPLPPKWESVNSKKEKKIKEQLIERMPNIHTSETQHKDLIAKFGEERTKECYEYLSEWKESKEIADPKSMNKHTDFYRIKKWVLAAVMEKSILSPKKEEVSVEKTYENRQKFEVFRRKYYELFRKKSIYLQDRVQYAEIKNDKIYFNDFKFDEKFECAIRKHGINLNEDRNTRQSDSENETQDD